jgi:hypothetical protein
MATLARLAASSKRGYVCSIQILKRKEMWRKAQLKKKKAKAKPQ